MLSSLHKVSTNMNEQLFKSGQRDTILLLFFFFKYFFSCQRVVQGYIHSICSNVLCLWRKRDRKQKERKKWKNSKWQNPLSIGIIITMWYGLHIIRTCRKWIVRIRPRWKKVCVRERERESAYHKWKLWKIYRRMEKSAHIGNMNLSSHCENVWQWWVALPSSPVCWFVFHFSFL